MNLFASLVDRALGRAPVLQRRRPTVFEPAKNAVLATRDTDLLREEQSYAEAENPIPRETKVVRSDPDETRVTSPTERVSGNTSTVTPKANDITIVEAQPAFKASAPEANEDDESQTNLPIRDQTLTQESPQQLATAPTLSPLSPSLDTIVEAKSEPQVVLQKPADESPLDEVDLTGEAPENVVPSIVNNVVVLRPASEQTDETLLLRPTTQRRPTRQQAHRSAHARSQSQSDQLETPTLPTINVTIGRVEVRASAPSKRAESARPSAPKLSLEEYLRGRSRGN
jgi:hypothetical protein